MIVPVGLTPPESVPVIDDAEIAVPTVPVLGLTPSDSEVVAVPMTIDSEVELAVSPLESVTVNTSPEVVPVAFGVPVMAPVEAVSVAQLGRVPEVSAQEL